MSESELALAEAVGSEPGTAGAVELPLRLATEWGSGSALLPALALATRFAPATASVLCQMSAVSTLASASPTFWQAAWHTV